MMFSHKISDDAELRPLEERHAEELYAMVDENRAHLRPFMAWMTDDYSIENARKFLAYALAQLSAGTGWHAGIWHDGALAGIISFYGTDAVNRRTTIGYWVGARHEGRGLVTRSCRALLDYAFDDLHLNRVEIYCAVENTRSRAIPERLGFKQEGVLRRTDWIHDRFVDIVIYGMLAEEWAELKKR